MYKLMLFTAALMAALSLTAQRVTGVDTLVVQMPKNGSLKLLADHPDQLRKSLAMDSLIAQFNQDWEGFMPDTYDPSLPARIDYQVGEDGQRKIRLQQDPNVPQSALISPQGQVRPGKTAPDQVWVDFPHPKVDMLWEVDYLEDLEEWESLSLDKRMVLIQEDLTTFKTDRSLLKNNKVVYDHIGPAKNLLGPHVAPPLSAGSSSYMQLGPVWGAGLIRNTLVPDLGLSIRAVFPNHRKRMHWEVGANVTSHWLFETDPEGKFDPQPQVFVNAYYRSINLDKSLGAGISLGYLVSKEGNYFEDNTVKIGFPVLLGKSAMNIVPELYFPGKIKGAFPGLRVSWGF